MKNNKELKKPQGKAARQAHEAEPDLVDVILPSSRALRQLHFSNPALCNLCIPTRLGEYCLSLYAHVMHIHVCENHKENVLCVYSFCGAQFGCVYVQCVRSDTFL